MAIAARVSTPKVTPDREYSLLKLGTVSVQRHAWMLRSCLCGSKGDFHAVRHAPVTSLGKAYRDRKTFLQGAWGAGVITKDSWFSSSKSVVVLEIALDAEEAALVGHPTRGIFEAMFDMLHSACTIAEKETVNVIRAEIPRSLYDTIGDAICRATQEKTGIDTTAAVSAVSFAKKHFQTLVKEGDVELRGNLTLAGATMAVAAIAGFIAMQRALLIEMVQGDEDDEYEPGSDVDEAEDIVNECGMAISRRVPDTAPKELRESVELKVFTADQRAEAAERMNETLPELKEVCKSTDRLIGPAIFDATASMDTDDPRTEFSGVKRHLNKAKQLEYDPGILPFFETAADLVEEVLLAACDGEDVYEPKLPPWPVEAAESAEAQIAEQRPHMLKGFAKPQEVGLPINKDARLVGTVGVNDCAAMAMGVSLVEAMFKKKFPGAVTKGLNMDDLDQVMANRLRQFSGYSKASKALGMLSNDFSAMDSSWKPHEKVRVVSLIRKVAIKLGDTLYPDIDTYDPIVDTCPSKGLMWVLRHMIVYMDVEDAILFSGERGTSLYNRMLVLILRTAELIRLQGVEEANALWIALAKPTGGKHQDTGDGDDTAFNNPGYKDVDDCIAAYRKYAKWIEPVWSDGHCMEVLSRYTTLLSAGKGVNKQAYHLAKIERNAQRMVIGCFPAEDADATFTARMHAMTATTLLDRAVSCKQTMVLRWYAMSLAHYHIEAAVKNGSHVTVLSKDGLRASLGDTLDPDSVPDRDLKGRYDEVFDLLVRTRVSGWAMVEWTHWGGTLPVPSEANKLCKMWEDADNNMQHFHVNDDDFARPYDMVERMHLEPPIKKALSIRAKPLAFDMLLAGRPPPSSSEAVPEDPKSWNKGSREAKKPPAGSESTPVSSQGAGGATTPTANVDLNNSAGMISLVVDAVTSGFQAGISHSKGKSKGKGKPSDGNSLPRKGKGKGGKQQRSARTDGAANPGGAGIRRSFVATEK